MNIKDVKIGEYYAYEFKIFKGEPPVLMKVIDWGEEENRLYVVRAFHQYEKPFDIHVSSLRELTSGEIAQIVNTNLKRGLENFFGALYDVTYQIWQGIVSVYTMLWKAYVKYVTKIRCKIFDKHDVHWSLCVQYSDSDHEYYLVGYCKDCDKRHTKGLYY